MSEVMNVQLDERTKMALRKLEEEEIIAKARAGELGISAEAFKKLETEGNFYEIAKQRGGLTKENVATIIADATVVYNEKEMQKKVEQLMKENEALKKNAQNGRPQGDSLHQQVGSAVTDEKSPQDVVDWGKIDFSRLDKLTPGNKRALEMVLKAHN